MSKFDFLIFVAVFEAEHAGKTEEKLLTKHKNSIRMTEEKMLIKNKYNRRITEEQLLTKNKNSKILTI